MAITQTRPADSGKAKATQQRAVGPNFRVLIREHRAADDAENLSDIDDSELVGYLNNTKEMHYKKIIWEKLNQEFAKSDGKLESKKRKREIGGKKDVHAKRSAKTDERVENKRTSSKINYDALQKLTDELKQVSEEAELGGLEPKACGDGDSVSEDLNIGLHELHQDHEYGEYDDSLRDNCDDSYYGYETGYYNGEDFDTDY